jgi:hypothetical protein
MWSSLQDGIILTMHGVEGYKMKSFVALLFCLFVLVSFHFSPASANPNSTDSPLTSSFSSPESTWSMFKASLLAGDYDMAEKCCCSGKNKHVRRFEKMDEEKRKNLLLSMQSLKMIEQQENTAKYTLTRDINGVTFTTFVYFEKVEGEWKIASY